MATTAKRANKCRGSNEEASEDCSHFTTGLLLLVQSHSRTWFSPHSVWQSSTQATMMPSGTLDSEGTWLGSWLGAWLGAGMGAGLSSSLVAWLGAGMGA